MICDCSVEYYADMRKKNVNKNIPFLICFVLSYCSVADTSFQVQNEIQTVCIENTSV